MHGFSFANYLQELGPTAQQSIYEKSSIDLAMRDAFRKMRAFLMTTTGNWGVHAIIQKSLFVGSRGLI